MNKIPTEEREKKDDELMRPMMADISMMKSQLSNFKVDMDEVTVQLKDLKQALECFDLLKPKKEDFTYQ